jgi:hypothetical protein
LAQDDGPHSDSDIEIASVVLANLDAQHLAKVTAMAEHVSEILTGYKSGSLEVAGPVFATGRQEGACGACRSLPSRNA